MVDKLYLASPALEAEARVSSVAQDPEHEILRVRLDRSPFHPQGGGQRADRGWLGEHEVLDVRHSEDGEVDHLLAQGATLEPGQSLLARVDPEQRLRNARLHSAGHLLAALVEARHPGAHAISGHHWPGEARVDFAGDALPEPQDVIPQLEQDLEDAIAAALPIEQVGDAITDRKIQIGKHPAVPCGGTHLSSTDQLPGVTIRKAKLKSGKLRISYAVPNA
jgi:alanyl-tRNA synthetase